MIERWHPTRAGVVNVWRYLEETFTFHNGRLLLRGPNGSGKSMALELLFPFLLDANAAPTRLSSAARSRGGLLERLLTGSEVPSRAGFLWAEFHLGEERVFTIGARLRASEATRKVTIDWFTTTLVAGQSLHLLDENRTPLSRAGLVEALGEQGTVYDGADAYREAVRTTLFPGFSVAQYDAMITALLALRREKISQDLTPARLSEILTASLPPVDEHDITEVAEGFEKLDRRKDNLARLEAELDLVRKLAVRHRTYAQAVLAGVTGDVRTAETRRDDVTRNEREARQALTDAATRREALDAEHTQTETGIRDQTSQIEALRASDAYKQGGALEQLRQELGRLRQATERARGDAAEREGEARDAETAHEQATATLGEAESGERRARTEADAAADPVGATGVLDEADPLGDDEAERLLEAWRQTRDGQIRDVRCAARTLTERIADRERHERQVEADRETLETQQAAAAHAERSLEEARDAYTTAIAEWAASCVVLTTNVPFPDTTDPDAVTAAVGAIAAGVRSEIAVERERLGVSASAVRDERDELLVERETLASGRTPEPDVPAWRTDRRRTGAALWRLVDFADHCDVGTRDRVEAALLASGILDAWLADDGSVSLPDSIADTFGDPGWAAVDGPSLRDVLVPLDGGPVPAEITGRLLRAIALVPDGLAAGRAPAVGRDGTFRLGPIAGRGPAGPASFIGAAAQERRRAQRIAAIDVRLTELQAELDRLDRLAADVGRRESLLNAELAALPDGAGLKEAARAVELAVDRAAQADARLAESRKSLDAAERATRQAQVELMRLAAEHSLPTGEDELDAYADAVANLARRADTWLRRRHAAHRAALEVNRAQDAADKARESLRVASQRVDDAERDERDVATRLHALEANVGAGYQEIVARLEAAEARRITLERQRVELVNQLLSLGRTIGKLENALEEAEKRRAEADQHRERAHQRFVAAVADGIGTDAGIGLDTERLEGVTAVRDAARSVAQELADAPADEQARDQAHARVMEALHTARQSLGGHIDFSLDQTDHGWWLLRAATDGIRRGVQQLRAALETELQTAREELHESERRLFDETLTGSVRQSVAERIRRCTELVAGINVQLAEVRTAAAGVQVKLRWEVDPEQPDAVRSARALLLKDPADLTDPEREALYAFFRARLDQVRASLDGSAGWETRLREVLDYRDWHRFALEVAHRDWEGFAHATTARLQRLSTGERSMALHLPMLASITAHYGGAGASRCPRLILLDELFAGVDTANRGQLFGMLVTWDLDAVLTSDHEWCAYASLDGIAIHHLHPSDDQEPVTSTRFVWDGRRRAVVPVA